MSGKSTKLNRPFERKVWKIAEKIAAKYGIFLTQEDGQWYGRGVELPDVFADGKTPNECTRNTVEALTAAIAYLLEKGEVVPAPATEANRTEQVNIRLTPLEKIILSTSARSQGYRGVGDFMRAKAFKIG